MTAFADDDRQALQAGARAAFDDCSSSAQVRAAMMTAQGWDRALWQRLCGELGIAGLAVPEELGGAGGSVAEAALVFEEAGRSLLCAPLFATTALALPQLLAAGETRWVAEIVAGDLVATVATADVQGGHQPGVAAARTPEGWALSGTAGFVVDGASADLVLVPALVDGSPALFAAQPSSREPLVTLDLTRKQAHLTFDATPAELVGALDAALQIGSGFDVARALLASEIVGGAQAVLDLTVAYAKQRLQFGRPIGSFQVVKAKLADLLVLVESARSAATHAAQSPDSLSASVAHAFCTDAYVQVTSAAIQLHGGIGFTWEHDVHLWFKRAKASATMLGTASQHLDAIADVLAEELS